MENLRLTEANRAFEERVNELERELTNLGLSLERRGTGGMQPTGRVFEIKGGLFITRNNVKKYVTDLIEVKLLK